MRISTVLALSLVFGAFSTVPALADDGAHPADAEKAADSGVIDGANVDQFLGSGAVVDRAGMDLTAEKLQMKYGDIDPTPLAEQKAQQAQQAARQTVGAGTQQAVASAKTGQEKKKPGGFKKFMKAVVSPFAQAAEFIGFPVGPDTDPNTWNDGI